MTKRNLSAAKKTSRRSLVNAVVPGGEVALLALAKAYGPTVLSLGAKAGSALVDHWSKKGPVPAQVAASWSEDHGKTYRIAIVFLNTTLHGAYVETIKVAKPKDFQMRVAISERPKAGINLGGPAEIDDFSWEPANNMEPLCVWSSPEFPDRLLVTMPRAEQHAPARS